MAKRQESQYNPVGQDDGCGSDSCVHADYHHTNIALLRWSFLVNFVLSLAVVGLGASLSLQYQRSASAASNAGIASSQLLEEQYGVSTKVPTTYKFFQDGFDDGDFQKGDPYWAGLFPKGNGLVFLSDEDVETYRLPPSVRQPERGNRSVYEIAGYHSLHCLSAVRRVIDKLLKAQETSQPYVMDKSVSLHLRHCLGDARQYILCHFDETLLVGQEGVHPGRDQTKLCKDLDPINKWLEDHYIPLA